MADQIIEVTQKGFFKRLGNSIKGILIGLLLFLVSFGVLFWNEGRINITDIARTATEISAIEQVLPETQGALVSTSGTVISSEKIGDNLFLKSEDYLAVQRKVEMYSWVEYSKKETESNLGGSETEKTTYSYREEWTESPEDSLQFKEPTGHVNPAKEVTSDKFTVKSAKIGNYTLDISKVNLPSFEDLALSEDMLSVTFKPNAPEAAATRENIVIGPDTSTVTISNTENTGSNNGGEIRGNYFYPDDNSISSPVIGDIRISYSVIRNNINGTVFGKLNASNIEPYYDEGSEEIIYRLFEGSRDEAMAQMQNEYTMSLWIYRLIGFVLMWIGLSSLFGPFVILMDVVPALGSVSKYAVNAVTFIVALILSLLTIFVSMVFHSWVALIGLAVAGIAAVIIYIMSKK